MTEDEVIQMDSPVSVEETTVVADKSAKSIFFDFVFTLSNAGHVRSG